MSSERASPGATGPAAPGPVDLLEASRRQEIVGYLRQRDWTRALAVLSPLSRERPASADIKHLLGGALRGAGDLAGAEDALQAAVRLNPAGAAAFAELGLVLAARGRAEDAETALRRALELAPAFPPAALSLSDLLCQQDRAEEAVLVFRPLVAAGITDEALLSAYAEALKSAGRTEAACLVHQDIRRRHPASGVAEHNLAATLADLGRYSEAEAAAQSAIKKGVDRAETWLLLGRALQRLDRFDAAKDAFGQAIQRAPGYVAAEEELAHLIWMTTGDVEAATANLVTALGRDPSSPGLRLALCRLLESSGRSEAAFKLLDAAGDAAPPAVKLAGARALLHRDPERALMQASSLPPTSDGDGALQIQCEALLALGEGRRALSVLSDLRRLRPLDQHLLAYEATALRLEGDPCYHALYDYPAFVRVQTLEVPSGWSTLQSYLVDLKAELVPLHQTSAHPIGQSLRLGTQTTQRIERSGQPAIEAFFQAITTPVQHYLDGLGAGEDVFRRRNVGACALAGAWSARLSPGGGRHVNHVHQKGWISSAFYVDIPEGVGQGDRAGWLQFGEPGTPTKPALQAEYFVQPQAGDLVLFPSYMWHGTLPFGGLGERLSIAFDLLPKISPSM